MDNSRTITLHGQKQREALLTMIPQLPIDGSLDVVIQPHTEKRTSLQNSRYWSKGILSSIVEQGWLQQRQFGKDAWHHFLREKFMPEDGSDNTLTLKGYTKWMEKPNGGLLLVASTTKLTTKGMCQYCDECEIWASTVLGVQFPCAANRHDNQ